MEAIQAECLCVCINPNFTLPKQGCKVKCNRRGKEMDSSGQRAGLSGVQKKKHTDRPIRPTCQNIIPPKT
jgi:hypothetical protein